MPKRHIGWHIVAPLVVGSLLICGCDNQTTKGTADTIKDTVETSVLTRHSPNEPQRPQSEMFILDVSESMKGYLDGDKRGLFRGVMAAFTESPADSTTCHYYGTKMGEPLDKEAFKRKREERSIPWAGESNLKGMIKTILDTEADMGVLLTDGIMSGTAAQIRREREYNKQNGPSMASELRGMLEPYAGKRSALIVRYESHFKGDYYYYDNEHKKIDDTARPFFIIAIGDWAYVKWTEQRLREGKATGDAGSEFGWTDILMIGDAPSFRQHVLSIHENVERKDDRYRAKRGRTNEDMVFSLDLSALPDYMQEDTWIRNHVEVLVKKSDAVTPIPYSRYKVGVEKTARGNMMLFRLTPHHPKGQTVILRLKYELPQEWTVLLSADDDKLPTAQGRTFNLNHLVQGFSALHEGKYVYTKELKL